MYLYLVQHAEAKSKAEDPDRPLSEQGQANIGKVAAYLAKNAAPQVNQITHSGKTRAAQTAEQLAGALSPAEGVNTAANLSPMADPAIWAKRLAAMQKNQMLVGHLPHLSRLAATLLCGDAAKTVVDFQNAGVVCLVQDDKGQWSVRWVVTPEVVA